MRASPISTTWTASVTFVAEPGLTLTCDIINTAAPVDLDVTKTALGGDDTFQFVLTPIDPPGEAQVASTVTEGGTGVATFTNLVAGGTYSITESDAPGWIEGELTCTVTHADDSSEPVDITAFTVESGDSIACAVENEALGAIVIVKNVEGEDGIFDFTGSWLDVPGFSIITTDGTGSQVSADVPAGEYTVEEVTPVGFDNTEVICTDGDPQGDPSSSEGLVGQIALDPGETVICTFTNTQWGTILVDKATLPAGSEQEFDFEWGPDGETFTLTDEAEAYSTGLIAPGPYTISESELDDWTLTGIVCTGADGEPVVDGSSVSVVVPLQATVLCTFTNTAVPASVTVEKTVDGVTDDYDWSFGFTLDPADGVTPGAAQTISGTGSSTASATWDGLIAGQTYTLSEDEALGWEVGELTCEGITDLDDVEASVTFVAEPGLTLTCAITNAAVPASVTVEKTVDGVTDDYDWSFGFTLDPADGVTPGAAQTISGTGSSTASATWDGLIAGQTYTLSEDEALGWEVGELTCEGITDLDDVDSECHVRRRARPHADLRHHEHGSARRSRRDEDRPGRRRHVPVRAHTDRPAG